VIKNLSSHYFCLILVCLVVVGRASQLRRSFRHTPGEQMRVWGYLRGLSQLRNQGRILGVPYFGSRPSRVRQ
jgi:hypothetical protein